MSASVIETRGSGRGSASQGRDKEHPGQSREAPPRSRSNGEAGPTVEDSAEGATLSSTASTTAIISKEMGSCSRMKISKSIKNLLFSSFFFLLHYNDRSQ